MNGRASVTNCNSGGGSSRDALGAESSPNAEVEFAEASADLIDESEGTDGLTNSNDFDFIPLADVLAEQTYFSFDSLPPFPHPLKRPLQAAYWVWELLFGVVSLFAFLAFLAAVPVANVLALGYMLEAR